MSVFTQSELQAEFERQLAACLALTFFRRGTDEITAAEEISFQGLNQARLSIKGKSCYPLTLFQGRQLRELLLSKSWLPIERITLPDGQDSYEAWINPRTVALATLTATESENYGRSRTVLLTLLGLQEGGEKNLSLLPLGLLPRAAADRLVFKHPFRAYEQPDPRGIAYLNTHLEHVLEAIGAEQRRHASHSTKVTNEDKHASVHRLPVVRKTTAPKILARQADVLPFRRPEKSVRPEKR